MAVTQENREIEIITPLGKDVLLLQGFTVTEKLGRLFTINAELLSVDDVVFEDILGQNVDIRVDLPEGKRFFNGYISSFSQDSHDGTYARYHATIHPWFWFLTRSSDCRIFQNKTVPEIIRKVCSDLGFTDISDKLSGEYRQWEYCVQYRETNFNFLSRLMEQEGIYYFFSHEQGKHTLNLCDCYSSHEVLPDNKEIPYDPEQGAIANKKDSIHHWLVTKEIQSSMYALNEYDSTRPKMNEHVDSSIIQKHANADFELYDYPGEYVEPSDGRNYAKIRIEEQQTKYELLQGQSNVRGLLLGGLFSLADYPREDQNREYLLDSITQSIYTSDFVASGGSSSSYSNSFTVINSQTPFRSARITPKPIVQGPQTAVVVGSSGEDIYPDEYGRIKVQFHWDRQGKADENSSCWLRVSQNRAGKGWGEVYIPHVGQEVIVSFLEGDPNNPIVTGRVYNGDNKPPIELPANKTQLAMRDHGGNEVVMEGAEGKQRIRLHSPYSSSTINIGAPNSPSDGISSATLGFCEWVVGKDTKWEIEGSEIKAIKGDKVTYIDGYKSDAIYGTKRKLVVGKETNYINGLKFETVLGTENKVNMVNKNELILGLTTKLHLGSKIEKTPSNFQTSNTKLNNAKKECDKHDQLIQLISGICNQKIATCNQKIGTLNAKMDSLNQIISGSVKILAGTLELASNGDMKMIAADIDIDCPLVYFHKDGIFEGSLEIRQTTICKDNLYVANGSLKVLK